MKVYLGDVGTVFRVSVGVDLTDATDTVIKVKKPDNTEHEWTASVESPASAGIIVYTADADDINQAGTWYFQSLITFPDGEFSGDTVSIIVYNEYK